MLSICRLGLRRLSSQIHLRSPPLGSEPFLDGFLSRPPKRPSRTLDVRNRERSSRISPRQLADSLAAEYENATESEMIVAAEKQRTKSSRVSKKEKWDEGNQSWGE
jgi:hypothetical protein